VHIGCHGMCGFIRDGLNVAPIAATHNGADFRVQKLALQLGERRVLARRRRAHSGSASERSRFNANLLAEPARLTIDVGDFNERPVHCDGEGRAAICPEEPTFRRHPHEGEWLTTIDGAVFATALAATAAATAWDPVEHSQRRPVLVEAALPPEFREGFRWAVEPMRMGAWGTTAKGEFADALPSDIDQAWAIWADAAGALEAENAFGMITSIVDDANSVRLRDWRQRMGARGGAAKWMKRRLDALCETILPAVGAEVMSPRKLAQKLSWRLARQLRTYQDFEWIFTVFAMALVFPVDARPRFDLSLLPSALEYRPLGHWRAERILEFLPEGASGSEGQFVAWVENMRKDSLDRLALLLTAADAGRLPGILTQARVTILSKGLESPPGDRRPLTVLPVACRLWTRRHAAHLTQWLLEWQPAGLAGAVPRHSCPDVWCELQAKLAQARVAQTDPAYVLSLDLEKCYDWLDLHNLLELTNHLGLDICRHVLRNYQNLSRILFVDYQPTDVVLQGDNLVGVPQGCPVACFLCNLTSIMWHLAVERAVPTAALFSCVGGRFILARSWQELANALAATREIDRAIGPDLNVPKCARELFHYGQFRKRVDVIKISPQTQRGAGVADAVVALWCDGGYAFTKTQMSDAAAVAAVSFMGNASPGRVGRRSRDLAHLLGPGAHRTHLTCAAVYTAIRMFYRVVLANIVPLSVWRSSWAQRRRHKFGPFTLLDRACRALGIEWHAATSFKSTHYAFTFSIRPELLAQADRRDYPRLRKPARVDARLHDLCVFLRRCLAEREAARRPKDFGGLHQGFSEVRGAREHMFGAQLHYGGPALTTGGIWTSLSKTRNPNHDGDEICVRCKGALPVQCGCTRRA
ncbi:unnamed protein product, partial [Prorocentrum cordatum]